MAEGTELINLSSLSSIAGTDQMYLVRGSGDNHRVSVAALATGVAPFVDHGNLLGLTDDDHTQYVKNLGRGTIGQVVIGGTTDGVLDLAGNGTDFDALTLCRIDNDGSFRVLITGSIVFKANADGIAEAPQLKSTIAIGTAPLVITSTTVVANLNVDRVDGYHAKDLWDLIFLPQDNEPPTSNPATLDLRNNHPVLDFDTTTAESAIFSGRLPRTYAGGGITVEVHYSMATATTGTCGWTIEIERIGDSQLDVDADSFATAQTITAVTVPGTSGHVDVVSVNISSGANMDSLAAGEFFRIRVKRDVANDTASGDAELHMVTIKEQ
jgi:hypothetical protein